MSSRVKQHFTFYPHHSRVPLKIVFYLLPSLFMSSRVKQQFTLYPLHSLALLLNIFLYLKNISSTFKQYCYLLPPYSMVLRLNSILPVTLSIHWFYFDAVFNPLPSLLLSSILFLTVFLNFINVFYSISSILCDVHKVGRFGTFSRIWTKVMSR